MDRNSCLCCTHIQSIVRMRPTLVSISTIANTNNIICICIWIILKNRSCFRNSVFTCDRCFREQVFCTQGLVHFREDVAICYLCSRICILTNGNVAFREISNRTTGTATDTTCRCNNDTIVCNAIPHFIWSRFFKCTLHSFTFSTLSIPCRNSVRFTLISKRNFWEQMLLSNSIHMNAEHH